MNYRNFLEGLQLRHFSADELIAQGNRTRNGVSNSLPPESMWPAMVPTLWVADMLRERLGSPLTITSAYRSEAYNRQVGGASRSAHLRNEALDLIPAEGKINDLWRVLLALRRGGAFKGGLGYYPKKFIHLDTRGVNATWGKGR